MKKTEAKVRGLYEKDKGSGIWWIRWTDSHRKEHREKVGRRSDALQLYRERKTDVRRGIKLPVNLRSRGILFDELVNDALKYSREHKNDVRNDESRAKYVLEAFKGRLASSITPQEIDAWLSSRPIEDSTRNRYKALLGLIYRQGNRNGKVEINPARLVSRRAETNGRIRWLRTEAGNNEEKRVRAAIRELCPQRMPEFDLALYTGIRQSVQMAMRRSWVDFERQFLHVPWQVMKNRDGLNVPLHDKAIAALQELARRSTADLLCPETPRHWWERVLQRARVEDFVWHDLRHTFISRLVMAGVDLRAVQQLAGHKTIAMTVRYAHLAPDHLRNAISRMTVISSGETGTKTGTSASRPKKTSLAPQLKTLPKLS